MTRTKRTPLSVFLNEEMVSYFLRTELHGKEEKRLPMPREENQDTNKKTLTKFVCLFVCLCPQKVG